MTRYSVHVHQPTPFIGPPSDPERSFEAAWARIPHDEPRRRWAFLPEEGLFLKGRADPFRAARPLKWLKRSTRIPAERRALAALRERGLPVPEIVAWGVERRFGLPLRSFLAVRLVPGALDLGRYLETSRRTRPAERRLAVMAAVGRAVARLHAAGCIHRDLSARNVLVRLTADPEVFFIDCPRGRYGLPRVLMPWLRRGDLYHLVHSVRRLGASETELRALLHAAGLEQVEALLGATHDAALPPRARWVQRSRWVLLGRGPRRLPPAAGKAARVPQEPSGARGGVPAAQTGERALS